MKREIVDLKNSIRSLQKEVTIPKDESVEYRGVLDHVSSVGSNQHARISGEAWEVAEMRLKLKELGDEAVELRKENSRLAQANLDLMKKMEEESTKIEDCNNDTNYKSNFSGNSSSKAKFLTMLKKIVSRKDTQGGRMFSFSTSSSSSPSSTTPGVTLSSNKTNSKSLRKLKRRASFDNSRTLNSQIAQSDSLGSSMRRFSFRI